MRRFKAIYLAIILAVLWIGAGVAAWYLLITPEKEKYTKAESEWDSSKKSMKTAQAEAQTAQGSYKTSAETLLDGYRRFHEVQNSMPDIWNMKAAYAANERLGLEKLYKDMAGSGKKPDSKLVKELTAWTKKYKLGKNPTYRFAGILGYEPTLTSVRMVLVSFGPQMFRAYGYKDLLDQISKRYGYGHCPLLIAMPGTELVTVNTGGGGAAGTPGASGGGPGATPTGPPAPGMTPPTGGPAAPPGSPPAKMNHQTIGKMQSVPAPPGPPSPGATPPGVPPPGATPGATPGAPPADAGGAAPAASSVFKIEVDQKDRRHTPGRPALKMAYNASGILITKGWDPLADKLAGAPLQDYLAQAKSYMVTPPVVPAEAPPEDYPLIFGFFGARDDVK